MEQNLKLESVSLENAILAYSILNQSFFIKVKSYLFTGKQKGKSYFTDSKYQIIFNLICAHFDNYSKLPVKDSILIYIERSRYDDETKLYLKSIIETIYKITREEIDELLIETEVINFIKEAKVYEAFLESQEDLATKNYGKIVSRVEDAVRVNFDKDFGMSVLDYNESYERLLGFETQNKIPTWFPNLDNYLDGGMSPKEIISIAGTPGIGKTLILGNIAINNFMNGKKVIIYTFETSAERLLMRYYSNIVDMSKKEIITSKDTFLDRMKQVSEAVQGNLIVKEYNANSICSNDLLAHLNELYMYNNWKPDLVIVDYILIMRTNDKSMSTENSYKYYKTVTEELRNIAKTLEVPVLTACQINREGMSDHGGSKALITAKQISESRGIYDTVDVFLTISQTQSDKKNNRMFLYFDKNRNERTGIKIEYEVKYEFMKLAEKGATTV